MRKDTTFSDRKLTEKEFSDKYWMGGQEEYIYQYHSGTIEDGRDEREQFIFNNMVALWNIQGKEAARRSYNEEFRKKIFKKLEKKVETQKKEVTILKVLNLATLVGMIILFIIK